jgi:hypothetical protein
MLIVSGDINKVNALAKELHFRFKKDGLEYEVVAEEKKEVKKEPIEEKPKRKRRTKEEMQKDK